MAQRVILYEVEHRQRGRRRGCRRDPMESGALRGCLDPPLATDERRRGKLGDLGEARGVAVVRRAMGMDEQYGVGADRAMDDHRIDTALRRHRSEEHTSELQSLMPISYAVFCLKKK